MEDFRFETSESVASFMISTPIWSDSWGLCNAANIAENIQIQEISEITYVAFPALPMIQLGNLVDLKTAGDGLFSAVSTTLAAGEPPPMVDSAILELFLSSFKFVQSQIIKQDMETQSKKLIVLTGHSAGGSVASLTALSLLSLPSPSFNLLCITFGSPLLTNQTLSSLISRSRLDHTFCHVVSIHDPIPRLLLSPPLSPNITHQISTLLHLQDSFLVTRTDKFSPFGTYLFCSDNGGVCLNNASSVRNMLLLLSNSRTPIIEHHLKYQHYVSTLSQQFLKSRTFLGGDFSDKSVLFAVESLGFSTQELAGVAVKECIETATRIVRAPIIRATELAIELGNVLSSRLEIQWYKDRCDASEEQLGYYDFFKRGSMKRDYKVNMSRQKLAKFWDKVIDMSEKYEVPFDFHLGKKWVYASQFYQLLTEPLDIANFYKHRDPKAIGHYMEEGNRPKRYVVIDKWWRQGGEPHKANGVRSKYASTTQDTCFWAKFEEAKECLDEIRRENDPQRLNLLWLKIVGFESYAKNLKEKMDVSMDVLAKRSSYSLWVKNLEAFRSELGSNGFHMIIDESSAMET